MHSCDKAESWNHRLTFLLGKKMQAEQTALRGTFSLTSQCQCSTSVLTVQYCTTNVKFIRATSQE